MQINLDKYFFYWFVLIDRFLFLFIYLYLPLHQTTANKGNWNTFSVVISESDSEDEYFEEDDGRFVFFSVLVETVVKTVENMTADGEYAFCYPWAICFVSCAAILKKQLKTDKKKSNWGWG